MLNIQSDLRARLAQAFPNFVVEAKIPDPRPERLIVVFREGGRQLNKLLDRPGIGVYIYAPTELETSKVAEKISVFFYSLKFFDGYSSIEQEAMFSDGDPKTNKPRWYLSYTLTTYDPKGNNNVR